MSSARRSMSALRALTSFSVVAALVALSAAHVVAGPGQAGSAASLSGTASSASGRSLADSVVQLRNVTTGQLAATTTCNAAGQFSFVSLSPGTYAVEVLNTSGQLVGVSQAVAISAGNTIAGIGVTAASPEVAAAGAGVVASAGVGPTAATMTAGMIAAAAGLATAVAVNATVSPSR